MVAAELGYEKCQFILENEGNGNNGWELDEYVVAVLFDPTCDGTERHFRSCSGFLANDLYSGN